MPRDPCTANQRWFVVIALFGAWLGAAATLIAARDGTAATIGEFQDTYLTFASALVERPLTPAERDALAAEAAQDLAAEPNRVRAVMPELEVMSPLLRDETPPRRARLVFAVHEALLSGSEPPELEGSPLVQLLRSHDPWLAFDTEAALLMTRDDAAALLRLGRFKEDPTRLPTAPPSAVVDEAVPALIAKFENASVAGKEVLAEADIVWRGVAHAWPGLGDEARQALLAHLDDGTPMPEDLTALVYGKDEDVVAFERILNDMAQTNLLMLEYYSMQRGLEDMMDLVNRW